MLCASLGKSGFEDHLVGAHEQRGRHFDPERLGLEVDDELEFGWLLNWLGDDGPAAAAPRRLNAGDFFSK
jgi:hypothetical protein